MSVLKIAAQKVNLLLIAAGALLSVACAGEEPRTSYASTDVESGEVTLGQPVHCESGAVQSCTIWLGQHGDLSNCVHGMDVCMAGEWSGCVDEETLAENPELYSQLAGDPS